MKAKYYEFTVGWQHWFSPQIEIRPEAGVWLANRDAFNGSPTRGIAPDRDHTFLTGGDLIVHF